MALCMSCTCPQQQHIHPSFLAGLVLCQAALSRACDMCGAASLQVVRCGKTPCWGQARSPTGKQHISCLVGAQPAAVGVSTVFLIVSFCIEGIFGIFVTCICIAGYMVMGMIVIYLLCRVAWLHGGMMNAPLGCRGLMACMAAVHSGLVRQIRCCMAFCRCQVAAFVLQVLEWAVCHAWIRVTCSALFWFVAVGS